MNDLIDREGCCRAIRMSLGLALSAGNEPTTPALHWAMTKSGLETMKSGEAITGMRRLAFSCSSVMAVGLWACVVKAVRITCS